MRRERGAEKAEGIDFGEGRRGVRCKTAPRKSAKFRVWEACNFERGGKNRPGGKGGEKNPRLFQWPQNRRKSLDQKNWLGLSAPGLPKKKKRRTEARSLQAGALQDGETLGDSASLRDCRLGEKLLGTGARNGKRRLKTQPSNGACKVHNLRGKPRGRSGKPVRPFTDREQRGK